MKKIISVLLIFCLLVIMEGCSNEFNPSVFVKDQNGIQLIVSLDKQVYSQRDPINIKVTIKNTTDKTIRLFSSELSKSLILSTIINSGENQFSVFRTHLSDKTKKVPAVEHAWELKAGEEYSQSYQFGAFYINDIKKKVYVEKGEYKGKAHFDEVIGVETSNRISHDLDFNVGIK